MNVSLLLLTQDLSTHNIFILFSPQRSSRNTTRFHLVHKFTHIHQTRHKVRLPFNVIMRKNRFHGRSKLAPIFKVSPLFLGSRGFLKVNNKRIVDTGEECIVDNTVIRPTIDGTRYVVARLLLESLLVVGQVEEFKLILSKDQTDTICLGPQECGKSQVECSCTQANKSCSRAEEET
jgi:hypothetical protein